MGSSCAYHLRRRDPRISVAVIERDPTYERASSALSAGNARIQFSLEQNIQISRYTFEVLESFADEMRVDDLAPDISFKPEGNLFLIDENRRRQALRSLELQYILGSEVDWLTPRQIESQFPLIAIGDCVGATYGPQDGHLDGFSFMMGYRKKADSLGAEFLEAEVVRIDRKDNRVSGVTMASGTRLMAATVVCCAGAWAARVLETAGVSIPVDPVQRQAFLVDTEVKPSSPMPLTTFPSGLYVRSEGDDRILVGKSLPEDRVGFDLTWSESRFNDQLWPELARAIPAFDRLKLTHGWAGLYAVNTLDGNAILGEWPELEGLYLANGFSGHGLQQAPAVGRYISELIMGSEPALDLSVLGPERILEGRPLSEAALI